MYTQYHQTTETKLLSQGKSPTSNLQINLKLWTENWKSTWCLQINLD